MKYYGLGLLLLLASRLSTLGQVTVEVTQDQQQFLPGESVPVAVRITNRSGQPLHLGAEDDWLTFVVQAQDGEIVSRLSEVPVQGEFTLESSKVAIKRVDLAPYYTLTRPGGYSVMASVKIREWNRELSSAPKNFDIIEGARLWEQEVGVPPKGASNGPPEVRRYVLQQANYIKGRLRLYLRVLDSYGRAVRVYPVGPLVSFSHPEPQVDKASHLHILYQDGPGTFSYTEFNLQGELITRRTYDYVNTRPRLRTDEDGDITVVGGIRRITMNDVPPPKTEGAEGALPPATPSPADATPAVLPEKTQPPQP